MASLGTKLSKPISKGVVRDNNFKDREQVKGAAPRCYETNSADGKQASVRGTPFMKGKLGG